MRQLWSEKPWNNQGHAGFATYKNTEIPYQGTYELAFLQKLESINGLDWVITNVRRGPSTWLKNPETGEDKLYLPDFLVGNTVYEIKSSYTWNQNGANQNLELLNQAKLKSVKEQGYRVVLVLDHKEQEL